MYKTLRGLGLSPADPVLLNFVNNLIGTQVEIRFTGKDGYKHNAAGVFKGLKYSTKYPGDPTKQIFMLQPSADTTNAAKPVPIGPDDYTGVYLDNVDWARPGTYNMQNWTFLGSWKASGTPPANAPASPIQPNLQSGGETAFAGVLGMFKQPLFWGIAAALAIAVTYIIVQPKSQVARAVAMAAPAPVPIAAPVKKARRARRTAPRKRSVRRKKRSSRRK